MVLLYLLLLVLGLLVFIALPAALIVRVIEGPVPPEENRWWRRWVLSRSNWWVEAFLCVLLLVSPAGTALHMLIVYSKDLCVGAIGSGITCELGAFSSYAEGVLALFEVSFILIVPPLYSAAGCVFALLYLPYCLVRGTIQLSRK